jgi:hypothetical protein
MLEDRTFSIKRGAGRRTNAPENIVRMKPGILPGRIVDLAQVVGLHDHADLFLAKLREREIPWRS